MNYLNNSNLTTEGSRRRMDTARSSPCGCDRYDNKTVLCEALASCDSVYRFQAFQGLLKNSAALADLAN
jgi:hypothetical protein